MKHLVIALVYEKASDELKCKATLRDEVGDFISEIVSPSDLWGMGATSDEAIEDYIKHLDHYIQQIGELRKLLADPKQRKDCCVRMNTEGVLMVDGKPMDDLMGN